MKRIVILIAIAVISVAHRQSSPATKPAIQLQPCDVAGFKEKIRCGSFETFENRSTRKGRKITLKIVVAPATSADRKPDPLFYIPGGPGSSATEDAPGVAILFANVRAHHDLVFVDQRGTGGSNPLDCKFYDANDPQTVFGY